MTDSRPAAPAPEPLHGPPHRGRDQAVWVGFFLILGIIASLAALFMLTDAAIFRGRYIVTTHVANAGGIRRGDPVQMRGVNIGRIQRFRISKEGVAIRLELEGEYDVPKDSRVELKSSGLLGGMVADVVPGESTEMLKGGDTLAGRTEPGVFDQADDIAKQAETVLGRMESLLSETTIKNVEASSTQMRTLLGQLSTTVGEQRRELNALTASLRRTSAGVEKVTTGPELDRTLKRLDSLSERMDGVSLTIDRSAKSMEGVMGRVERGEGTLGKLTRDEELYKNLNQAALNMSEATANISKLTEEIRRNPRKYLNLSVF